MTKEEVQQRVLQNGKPLALDKFQWDEDARVLSTTEHNLVIDFRGVHGVTFTTGSDCTFDTGFYCTFNTGSDCTFTTGSSCTFDTDFGCTFDTGFCCTFDTGSRCIFKTGSACTFTCGEECVVVRRDVYEIIEVPPLKTIKLNGFQKRGYTFVEPETIEVNGKTYNRREVEERLAELEEVE